MQGFSTIIPQALEIPLRCIHIGCQFFRDFHQFSYNRKSLKMLIFLSIAVMPETSLMLLRSFRSSRSLYLKRKLVRILVRNTLLPNRASENLVGIVDSKGFTRKNHIKAKSGPRYSVAQQSIKHLVVIFQWPGYTGGKNSAEAPFGTSQDSVHFI